MAGQPRRGDKIKPPASAVAANAKAPQARQGFRRRDLAEDHGIGYRVLASCRSKRSLGSIVIIKPLGTTAFRFEKPGTRRPGKQNLRPVRSGRNLIAPVWRVNPRSHEKTLIWSAAKIGEDPGRDAK